MNWLADPCWCKRRSLCRLSAWCGGTSRARDGKITARPEKFAALGSRTGCSNQRSEEHTSELQTRGHLVCRLLLEKKKLHVHRRAVAGWAAGSLYTKA